MWFIERVTQTTFARTVRLGQVDENLQAGGQQPRYDFSFRSPRQKYVKSGLVAEATELEKMLATPYNEFSPQPGSYTLFKL